MCLKPTHQGYGEGCLRNLKFWTTKHKLVPSFPDKLSTEHLQNLSEMCLFPPETIRTVAYFFDKLFLDPFSAQMFSVECGIHIQASELNLNGKSYIIEFPFRFC